MADFTIRTVNSTIATEHQHVSQATVDQALAIGVRGAVQIASDEIDRGATAAFVEVIVEDEAGDRVCRSGVSIAVGPLAVDTIDAMAASHGAEKH